MQQQQFCIFTSSDIYHCLLSFFFKPTLLQHLLMSNKKDNKICSCFTGKAIAAWLGQSESVDWSESVGRALVSWQNVLPHFLGNFRHMMLSRIMLIQL